MMGGSRDEGLGEKTYVGALATAAAWSAIEEVLLHAVAGSRSE